MKNFSYKLNLPLDCKHNTFYLRLLSGFIMVASFFILLMTASGQTLPIDQNFSWQSGHNIPLTPPDIRFFRPNNSPLNKETTDKIISQPQSIPNGATTDGLDPLFNPTLQTFPGTVNASAVQADGKIIIGGYFNIINGLPKRNLVRFNVDGTLDSSFNVNVSSTVTAVALQPDGKVIVGGFFNSINNINIYALARLNSDGSLDSSFNNSSYAPPPSDLAIQPDGKIIRVGNSSEITRLNNDGSRDSSFVASVNSSRVNTVSIQPDGNILIGGFFSSVDNTPAINGLARLNSNGSLDTSFNADIGLLALVNDITIRTDGKILAGGDNFSRNGSQINGVVQLNPNGSFDNSFNIGSGANGDVKSIALLSNGEVAVGGSFSTYNGVSHNSIAKLASNGVIDNSFNGGFNPDANIAAVSALPNNKIFAGGLFTLYNGFNYDTGVRLNADGSLDSSLMLTSLSPADVETSLTQADGKILIAGYFNQVNGAATSNHIVRLNPDGTNDFSFNAGSGANGVIYAMALQPNGKIIIGGFFTSFNGNSRNGIARLNPDGSFDTSFNPPDFLIGRISSLVLQPDGKIVIGGSLNTSNGTYSDGIARLNADGSVDTSFSSGIQTNSQINDIALQTDGKILFGGYFNQVNGVYSSIVRLNTNGSIDQSFSPATTRNTIVQAIRLQPNGKILIGGQVFNDNSLVGGIARLNADGSLDTSFGNGTAFIDSYVIDIALQPNGKILIGGIIDSINGVTRHNLARLNPDGSLDPDFNVVADDYVQDISLTDNGQKAIIGGYFTSIDGVERNGLARLFLEASPNAQTRFDFDGDGRADISVFRPSSGAWYRLNSADQSFFAAQFGTTEDKIAPADFDGDGKTDLAVFRPSTGAWYLQQSTAGFASIQFGQAGDRPVAADYDGDGKSDVAVFRPSTGAWFVNRSTTGFYAVQFGASTDVPAESAFVP